MGTHVLEGIEGGTKIRTTKGRVQTRGTYFLKSEKAGTSQYSERGRASEGDSRSEERGGTSQGQGKKAGEREALTPWRAQRGRTQDSERKRARGEHSHPGERKGKDKSKQRIKASG
jgi:hypothetical protein